MNRSETGKVLSVLTVAYPKLADENAEARMRLWHEMFRDDPYEVVMAATHSFITSDLKGFPPTIGQLKELIGSFKGERITAAEAVSLIMDAIKNGIYGYQEEFDKLPEVCKKIVVNPIRIREWAVMDIDEVQTVVASNLRRAFEVQARRDREEQALPEVTRNLIASLRLGDGDD